MRNHRRSPALIVSSMAEADSRQCQDMVAKDTEVLWSGEKSRLRGGGTRYSRFSGLLQIARKPRRCDSLASFFRRIRSVRDWLAERRGFELPRPFSIPSVRLRNKGASYANNPSLSLDFKHAQCTASDDPRLKENSAPVSFAR